MLGAYRANQEVSWLCFQLTFVLSVPASYKAVCKVPRGTAPVPAGEEARAVRLCQEVSAAPAPSHHALPHTLPTLFCFTSPRCAACCHLGNLCLPSAAAGFLFVSTEWDRSYLPEPRSLRDRA